MDFGRNLVPHPVPGCFQLFVEIGWEEDGVGFQGHSGVQRNVSYSQDLLLVGVGVEQIFDDWLMVGVDTASCGVVVVVGIPAPRSG